MILNLEYTDTFGGQANYCWVNRYQLELPDNASDATIVRRAKAMAGLTGVRCQRTGYSDTIELRPYGMATVLFILPSY